MNTSITNHHAIFHKANKTRAIAEQSDFISKRDYRHKNILNLKGSLAETQCDRILNEYDAQNVCSAFCNMITKYITAVSYTEHSKKNHIKRRLTSALNESMK